MECSEYVEAMMEADIGQLRGEGASALAAHVRVCADCARQAALLIRGTQFLAREMGMGSGADPALGVRRVLVKTKQSWPRRLAVSALPAAALVLLALGIERYGMVSPRPVDRPSAVATDVDAVEAKTPGVELQAGRNAVVFRTSNPKITVVWYYPTEGGP